MTTAKAILQIVQDLDVRRYAGDLAACDALIDLAYACQVAKITDENKRAMYLTYVEGYTQQEVADMLNVERSTIAKRVSRATTALDAVYTYWDYLDKARGTAA